MSNKNKESIIKEVYTKFLELGNKSEVARVLNLPRTTVRRYIDQFHGKQNVNENITGTGEDVISIDVPDGMTEEDIYKEHGLDPSQWQITNITKNEWTTPFKTEDGGVEYATNKQNKVVFKKLIPDLTKDVIKEQYALMAQYSPKVGKIKYDSYSGGVLLEIAIADAHIGKLCWAAETGESYDIKIAKERYISAVHDLLNKTCYFNIDKILMPIGNDLFNIDSSNNTTTSGTPQDVDSRFTKIFRVVSEALVEVIDMCAKVAPVDVIVVPGNHDRASCFYAGEFLNAWYRNNENVDIDNSPKLRKYYQYGNSLIGFTHGSEERHDILPLLMAREAKDEWGKCSFYEFQVGHFHKKKQVKYTSGDTHNGVLVRTLDSLSGTDFWHHSKGYTEGIRAATALIYHPEDGYMAEFSSKIVK